jgi:class I fructose-bisphosphate aldolase
VYDGSPAEPQLLEQFGKVVEEAHAYGIPVIAWMYPRGKHVHEHDTNTIAYAARVALELGADFVKVKHPHDMAGIPWIVQSAGKTRVLGADPDTSDVNEILSYTKALMDGGATGIAFGRAVWQYSRPYELLRALHGIVFEGRSVADVQKHLK